MNPNADTLWKAPRWALAVLLAVLGMLGPFSIDTYIPAFSGIATTIGATPAEMQQTLSGYLFGFAFMNLFHGALSDSFGRRPVVLWGLAVFTLASLGCALSQTIGQLVAFRTLQGLSTGAGIVVSRAVIRDMFPPADAQKVMAQVTIYFGVAPAIAPIIGGLLFVHLGWHSIFWFLVAVGVVLFVANFKLLPETLHEEYRQSFNVRNLMHGYWDLCSDPRFLLLALASGVPFNGMFLYVLSAPAFLGDHLGLPPTQFFWFFLMTIGGIMAGARASGRMAGQVAPKRQIRNGFLIMLVSALVNVVANALFAPHSWWAIWPIATFAFGWALMVPGVTLLVLDLHPERRGMASSLQAVIGSTANGVVAGVIAPLVMHSTVALALTSLLMLGIGLGAWLWLHRRWPEIGRMVAA
ncbi:multidrug effflux MFS transporter [Variovorax robiniae]|uniref:Bcr/CflA family efflux transporter n=1 Tax=Variovorax robiniae TaxID=1836199 RepID=A0ABU8X2G4_9BURK